MNYIIFDIEANARPYKTDIPQQVIQIGAVKLNSDLVELDAFSHFVKPTYSPKISKFSQKQTGISQVNIDNAQSFAEVYSRFEQWMDLKNSRLVCWGREDIKFLKKDCQLNQIADELPTEFINLLERFNKHVKSKSDISLVKAIEWLEIAPIGEAHSAIDDARNTAAIFQRIFNEMDLNQLDVYKEHPLNSKIRRSIKFTIGRMIQHNMQLNWEGFIDISNSLENLKLLINEDNTNEIKQYFASVVNHNSESR